jgi:hypothetical protein
LSDFQTTSKFHLKERRLGQRSGRLIVYLSAKKIRFETSAHSMTSYKVDKPLATQPRQAHLG